MEFVVVVCLYFVLTAAVLPKVGRWVGNKFVRMFHDYVVLRVLGASFRWFHDSQPQELETAENRRLQILSALSVDLDHLRGRFLPALQRLFAAIGVLVASLFVGVLLCPSFFVVVVFGGVLILLNKRVMWRVFVSHNVAAHRVLVARRERSLCWSFSASVAGTDVVRSMGLEFFFLSRCCQLGDAYWACSRKHARAVAFKTFRTGFIGAAVVGGAGLVMVLFSSVLKISGSESSSSSSFGGGLIGIEGGREDGAAALFLFCVLRASDLIREVLEQYSEDVAGVGSKNLLELLWQGVPQEENCPRSLALQDAESFFFRRGSRWRLMSTGDHAREYPAKLERTFGLERGRSMFSVLRFFTAGSSGGRVVEKTRGQLHAPVSVGGARHVGGGDSGPGIGQASSFRLFLPTTVEQSSVVQVGPSSNKHRRNYPYPDFPPQEMHRGVEAAPNSNGCLKLFLSFLGRAIISSSTVARGGPQSRRRSSPRLLALAGGESPPARARSREEQYRYRQEQFHNLDMWSTQPAAFDTDFSGESSSLPSEAAGAPAPQLLAPCFRGAAGWGGAGTTSIQENARTSQEMVPGSLGAGGSPGSSRSPAMSSGGSPGSSRSPRSPAGILESSDVEQRHGRSHSRAQDEDLVFSHVSVGAPGAHGGGRSSGAHGAGACRSSALTDLSLCLRRGETVAVCALSLSDERHEQEWDELVVDAGSVGESSCSSTPGGGARMLSVAPPPTMSADIVPDDHGGARDDGLSAFSQCLSRLVELRAGSIKAGGKELAAFPVRALRKLIWTLPERPFLLEEESVRDNLDPFREHTREDHAPLPSVEGEDQSQQALIEFGFGGEESASVQVC